MTTTTPTAVHSLTLDAIRTASRNAAAHVAVARAELDRAAAEHDAALAAWHEASARYDALQLDYDKLAPLPAPSTLDERLAALAPAEPEPEAEGVGA